MRDLTHHEQLLSHSSRLKTQQETVGGKNWCDPNDVIFLWWGKGTFLGKGEWACWNLELKVNCKEVEARHNLILFHLFFNNWKISLIVLVIDLA